VAVVNFILAALTFIGAILALVVGAAFLSAIGGEAGAADDPAAQEAAGGLMALGGGMAAIAAICIALIGLVYLLAGIGVMKRAQWGRILTLILGALAFIGAILNIVRGDILSALISVAYGVFVYAILLNSKYAAEFA
jgi:hypothetical protein